MRRGLPAVVAMQEEITDRATIEFTSVFYESLADGYPVDSAVTEGRKAISLELDRFDWVTVPEGEFLMGSDKSKDKDAYDDETPHQLRLGDRA